MRLVLALVTLSHVSISSSLSVRASSYLVSLPYEHFSNTLDTRPLFTLILLETGCFLNNRLKKQIWTHCFSTQRRWEHQEYPLKRTPAVTTLIPPVPDSRKKLYTAGSPLVISGPRPFWDRGNRHFVRPTFRLHWMVGSWMDADQWKQYAHTLFEDWGGDVCRTQGQYTFSEEWGSIRHQVWPICFKCTRPELNPQLNDSDLFGFVIKSLIFIVSSWTICVNIFYRSIIHQLKQSFLFEKFANIPDMTVKCR